MNHSFPTPPLAFLFGSGISIPAGIPSMSKITNIILQGKGIRRHSIGTYEFGEPLYSHANIKDEYIPRVVSFLNRLKMEIDVYYQSDRNRLTNYEDLYYLSSQIRDSELGEYDNPAVQPLIDKIMPDIKNMLVGGKEEIIKKWELNRLASESCNYISDVVWRSLNKKPNKVEHLSFVKECILKHDFQKVYIFTINHDTLLEQLFAQYGIEVIDGFGQPINNVRYWSLDLFDYETQKAHLYKLHGSINWFSFRSDAQDSDNEVIGLPLGPDIWHTKNPHGELQRPIDGRPLFLAGTFNKMLYYTSGIYAGIYCRYLENLRSVGMLIICGYGFGDKGINNSIIDWIYGEPGRKLYVIHPDSNRLQKSARGAISKHWANWIDSGLLTIVEKRVEEVSWSEIRCK